MIKVASPISGGEMKDLSDSEIMQWTFGEAKL